MAVAVKEATPEAGTTGAAATGDNRTPCSTVHSRESPNRRTSRYLHCSTVRRPLWHNRTAESRTMDHSVQAEQMTVWKEVAAGWVARPAAQVEAEME